MRKIDEDALAKLERKMRAGPVALSEAAEIAGTVRTAQRWIRILEAQGLDVVRRTRHGGALFQILSK